MWFSIAVLSSICFGLSGFFMKVNSVKKASIDYLLWGLYLSGTFCFLIWGLLTGNLDFGIKTIVAGVIIGGGSAIGNLLFMKALEIGPASLTSPLVNSNILLIVFMSLFLYGEKLTVAQEVGVAFLFIAVSLLPLDPKKSLNIKSKSWYGLVIVATMLFFLRNGGLKITQEMQLSNIAILFWSYLFSFVYFSICIARKGAAFYTNLTDKLGFKWGILSGVFSFLGLQLYTLALSEAPASIVAPIFSTHSLIVAVLSIAIYKEKLTKIQSVCLILLIVGLVIVRM